MIEADAEPLWSEIPKQNGGSPKARAASASTAHIFSLHESADRDKRLAPLLDEREVANLLKVSVKMLRTRRCTGDSPPFIKVGRLVRYSATDLVQWLERSRRTSTSDSS